MHVFPEVLSVVSDMILDIERKIPRTLLGEGGYGMVYKVSNGNGDSFAEKEMQLFNFDDLNSQNIREANYHKCLPKTKNTVNPHSVCIKDFSTGEECDMCEKYLCDKCDDHSECNKCIVDSTGGKCMELCEWVCQLHDDCECVCKICPSKDDICQCNKKDYSISVCMPLGEKCMFDYIFETTPSYRIPQFREIFSQVCVGLAPIHDNGMTHTDIKSRNILIDPITLHTVVIDLSGIHFETNNTNTPTSTLSYRPPELFEDEYGDDIPAIYRFGPHNDVWSLGVTMLEFLTGENRIESLMGEYMEECDVAQFVNRKNKFPVRRIVRENNLNPDSIELSEHVKLIEKMLVRNIESRISLQAVYKILTGKQLPVMIRTYECEKFPQSDKRTNVIVRFHALPLSESEKYSFDLAVSIGDRFCDKTGYDFTGKLFAECLYIAVCFLTDDTNGNCCEDIFGEKMNDNMKDCIVNIIRVLDFDIYRPTLYSYIQSHKRVTKFDREVMFELMGNPMNHGISHEKLYDMFLDLVAKKCSTPERSTIDRHKFITQ